MKKLVLAVALAVSNLVSAQSFNIKCDIFFYFTVPSTNSSNFKVENREDVLDLLYHRNASLDIMFGPNDINVSKNKLINQTSWNGNDTIIRYKNFDNYHCIDNIMTFKATGFDGSKTNSYTEYFFFDLNQLNETSISKDINTSFAVSYWYNVDGSINGIIITNGAIDSFSVTQ